MLPPFLSLFGVRVDVQLHVMSRGQSLLSLLSQTISEFDRLFLAVQPSLVIVQGDTSTAMAASMAAFLKSLPVGHVEAGLRSYRLGAPFPEEFNRQVISLVSCFSWAPSAQARKNLLAEGLPERGSISPQADGRAAASKLGGIRVTGNTVVDALMWAVAQEPCAETLDFFRRYQVLDRIDKARRQADSRVVFLTAHRRENQAAGGLGVIFGAVRRLANDFPHALFVFPGHPNPQVQEAASLLRGLYNVLLLPPLEYMQGVFLLRNSDVVLTDSGGLQEEAGTLGIPVVVLRETIERGEGVQAGVAAL